MVLVTDEGLTVDHWWNVTESVKWSN